MKKIIALALVAAAFAATPAEAKFQFEEISSLQEMQEFIRKETPLGTSRDDMRKIFVEEGKATLKVHPLYKETEKYLYDINLCSYYIWRWNISADFDKNGKATQVYLNGLPSLEGGGKDRDIKEKPGVKPTIAQAKRARPEASKGENALTYLLYDADGDIKTIADQKLVGGGPSNPDPLNMGKITMYENVRPWRSIFDRDPAEKIVAYKGDCSKVDEAAKKAAAEKAKAAQ